MSFLTVPGAAGAAGPPAASEAASLAAGQTGLEVSTLSGRPDMVTGGDALVPPGGAEGGLQHPGG